MTQKEKNIETVKSYVKEVIKKIEITQKFPDLIKSYITDDQVIITVADYKFGGVIELNLTLREGEKVWWVSRLSIENITTKKSKLASFILQNAIKIIYKKHPAKIYVPASGWDVFLQQQKNFYLKNNFKKKGSYFVYNCIGAVYPIFRCPAV